MDRVEQRERNRLAVAKYKLTAKGKLSVAKTAAKRASVEGKEYQRKYDSRLEAKMKKAKYDRVLGHGASRVAKRNAKKLQATPLWADDILIMEKYERANELTKATGIRHEVDHIIPLQGKTVSGLHVEYNLQVIPMSDNRRKANRLPS